MSQVGISGSGKSPEIRAMLSEILVRVVTNGGSVSFMHPLPPVAAGWNWLMMDRLIVPCRSAGRAYGGMD